MGYECKPECTEERIEVYITDDPTETAYTMVKAGFINSIEYRDKVGQVSVAEKAKINAEKEAWCPVHRKILKWKNPR